MTRWDTRCCCGAIAHVRAQLTWMHYRVLLASPDPTARRELARRALRENLNIRQIQKEDIR